MILLCVPERFIFCQRVLILTHKKKTKVKKKREGVIESASDEDLRNAMHARSYEMREERKNTLACNLSGLRFVSVRNLGKGSKYQIMYARRNMIIQMCS